MNEGDVVLVIDMDVEFPRPRGGRHLVPLPLTSPSPLPSIGYCCVARPRSGRNDCRTRGV